MIPEPCTVNQGTAFLHVVAGGGDLRGQAAISVDDRGGWAVVVHGPHGPIFTEWGGAESSAAALLSSLMAAAASHPAAAR